MGTSRVSTCSICLCLLVGCSGASGTPTLAPADGTVTYKGSPLAGATVTFIPASGPLAIGITDLNGKFVLKTGAHSGVALGSSKATVSITAPGSGDSRMDFSKAPTSDAARKEYFEKAAERMKLGGEASSQPKSLVPEKYGNLSTSGLSYTVKSTGDNHYRIDLVD